jgi:EpsI family protein
MSESSATTTPPAAVQPEGQPAAPQRRGPSTKQISIVVVILAVGVLLTATTSDVAKVSEPGVKLYPDGSPYLVDQAGDWAGGEKTGLTEDEQRLLPKDTEGSRRIFKDKDGHELFCSIVLAGRDVTSIHRPELCLPGQGWKIQSEYTQSIPVAAAPGGTLNVMRMNVSRPVRLADGRTTQARSVFAYWFVGKDRVTPYHWQRIYWTAKDRIVYNTNHRWAYILIHMPIKGDAEEGASVKSQDDAMKVVDRFIQAIYPALVVK